MITLFVLTVVWILFGALEIFLIERFDGPLSNDGDLGPTIILVVIGPLALLFLIPIYAQAYGRTLRRKRRQ